MRIQYKIFLYIQRLQSLLITSLIYKLCCYEIITLQILSVVFTHTRKSKLSWKKSNLFYSSSLVKAEMRKIKLYCLPRAGKNIEKKPPRPPSKTEHPAKPSSGCKLVRGKKLHDFRMQLNK